MHRSPPGMKLVDANDPILRTPAPEFTGVPPSLGDLAREMFHVMRWGNGVDTGMGLAAPQVGSSVRMFVMDVSEGTRRTTEVCINPRVIATGKKLARMHEGCLSFPGTRISVRRARSITAEWTRLDGYRVQAVLQGLEARVFQHELDHLNGVCIVPVTKSAPVAQPAEYLHDARAGGAHAAP